MADAGGVVVVNNSNRWASDALDWVSFILACPLYALLAPRGYYSILPTIIVMVANSLLVGYGLSGAIRMVANRQFRLSTLFVAITLISFCFFALTLQNSMRVTIILGVATVTLVLLAISQFVANATAATRRRPNSDTR